MKMKKVLKIAIILMILIVGFEELTVVRAAPPTMTQETDGGGGGKTDESTVYKERTQTGTSLKDVGIGNPNDYKPDTSEMNPIFDSKVGIVLGIIRAIGILLSVGALVVIGIKEMTASVEEKSNIKKAMPGYVIGIILVATMTTLPSIIYNMISSW